MGIFSVWKRLFKDYENNGTNAKNLDGWMEWRSRVNDGRFSEEDIQKHVDLSWGKIDAKLHAGNRKDRLSHPRLIYMSGSVAAAAIFGAILFLFGHKESSLMNEKEHWGQPAFAGAVFNMGNIQQDVRSVGKKFIKIARDSVSEVFNNEGNIVFKPLQILKKVNYVSNGSIQTPFQRTMNIEFSRNVTVKLNAGSVLYYSISANYANIHFRIKGEGYFHVHHHDTNSSIEVVASGHSIKDIGTEFDVSNYGPEALKVSVRQGLVAVDQLPYLKKDESYHFGSNTTYTLEKRQTDYDFAWLDNMVIFKSISLEALMDKISRWYNVKYFFKDNIAINQFSGSFPINIPLTDVIKILNSTGKMKLAIHDTTISISKP